MKNSGKDEFLDSTQKEEKEVGGVEERRKGKCWPADPDIGTLNNGRGELAGGMGPSERQRTNGEHTPGSHSHKK